MCWVRVSKKDKWIGYVRFSERYRRAWFEPPKEINGTGFELPREINGLGSNLKEIKMKWV